MSKYLFRAILAVILSTTASVSAQEPSPAVFVNVDEVGGLTAEGRIPIGGTDLTIPVRFHNVDDARTFIRNAYYFQSSAVTIEDISVKWNDEYMWGFEQAYYLDCLPWNTPPCYSWFDLYLDSTPITRGLGGFALAGLSYEGTGLPADFDDIACTFTLTGVSGPPGAILTMDSTWSPFSGFWEWSGVGTNVSWGGPYDFLFERGSSCSEPYTTCWPQPMKPGIYDNDRVLNVSIFCEDNDEVDLASVLIFGKIPSLTNDGVAWIEGDSIVTDAFLMRFLGCAGFRPLTPEGVDDTYFVTYVKNGTEYSLEGNFVLSFVWGDVTFDGMVSLDDVTFMIEYLFGGGPGCTLDGCKVDELMDVDQSGRFDMLDVGALIEMIY
ncbi:MAG: hypothetical protein JSV52_14125 [Candidatus Zixiibacteriota bacterium]|nr:MAG: hypothetical protein JSV52_14125 [candidate division Zixibacteria bacterium]